MLAYVWLVSGAALVENKNDNDRWYTRRMEERNK